ncbi:hypothetical protein BKP35_01565 [Anaerobacillus arseniciselenatis]|uniref:Macrolide ABC transporter permease n=1 Tax=Anaerobacillus arseniciselenatis TaxID=85682 RepID=A0A1S2LVM3_9BACI|nr:FtsX-like permease family protein [Anaerobacillus arseniciselenatis]OIJ15707.1 hypothetical protein BKP35_01565 [Anaerobacillus arseniciselenatis]
MRLSDQMKFVRRNMKKNRLRVFMTILATTMGCAFLIVLASVGFGVHKSIVEEMTQYQILTEIRVNGKDVNNRYEPIAEDDIEKLKSIEEVSAVVSRVNLWGEIVAEYDERKANVSIILTDMKEELKAKFELAEGRVPEKESEIIVGYHFAKNLLTEGEQVERQSFYETGEGELPRGYVGNLIDETVTVVIAKQEGEEVFTEEFEFTIAGIGREPSRDWIEDSNLYIGYEYEEQMISAVYPEEVLAERQGQPYSEVFVYAPSVNEIEAISNQLKEEGYYVYSISDELEGLNLFFTALKAGLIFVGTVTVLIASIGIFNTMTMAVTERTQDIGIMKAIGGDPSVIRQMFLMESAYIGILGSIIGVAFSYAISWLANLVIPLVLEAVTDSRGPIEFTFSYIPLSLVLISVSISIGVAILSGLRPAVKATNINVLSALRREI